MLLEAIGEAIFSWGKARWGEKFGLFNKHSWVANIRQDTNMKYKYEICTNIRQAINMKYEITYVRLQI